MEAATIRKRAIRKHVLEAAIAISIFCLIAAGMIPYFLHRQRHYSTVIDSCNNLDQWEVQTGLWAASDGIIAALPNPDGSPNWLLTLDRQIDAELLEYPVTVRFDVRFPEGPPRSGSCWIGIGFGTPEISTQTLDSPPLMPSIAATLRFEHTDFMGLFCYSQEKGWQENKPQRDRRPGIFNTLGGFRDTAFPPGMNITASGIYSSSPKDLTQIVVQGQSYVWNPHNWLRFNSVLSKPDFDTNQIQQNGIFFQIDGPPQGLNIQSEMPRAECFFEPRTDLVLFIYQSYRQVSIEFDNFRMKGNPKFPSKRN